MIYREFNYVIIQDKTSGLYYAEDGENLVVMDEAGVFELSELRDLVAGKMPLVSIEALLPFKIY